MTKDEFLAAVDTYVVVAARHDRVLLTAALILLLVPIAVAIIAGAGAVRDMALFWLIALAGYAALVAVTSRPFNRRHGVFCPNCNHSIAPDREEVAATGQCPHCNVAVIDTPL